MPSLKNRSEEPERMDDPSVPGFRVEEGQLVAGEAVGLGYHVNLG